MQFYAAVKKTHVVFECKRENKQESKTPAFSKKSLSKLLYNLEDLETQCLGKSQGHHRTRRITKMFHFISFQVGSVINPSAISSPSVKGRGTFSSM